LLRIITYYYNNIKSVVLTYRPDINKYTHINKKNKHNTTSLIASAHSAHPPGERSRALYSAALLACVPAGSKTEDVRSQSLGTGVICFFLDLPGSLRVAAIVTGFASDNGVYGVSATTDYSLALFIIHIIKII